MSFLEIKNGHLEPDKAYEAEYSKNGTILKIVHTGMLNICNGSVRVVKWN